MKRLLLAIALITGLLSVGQDVSAIAATPINPRPSTKQPVEFSEPAAANSPGLEHALVILVLLSLPVGKLLHNSYRSHRVVPLRKGQRKEAQFREPYLVGLLKMAIILQPLRNGTTLTELEWCDSRWMPWNGSGD
jgi:hypothetical protein